MINNVDDEKSVLSFETSSLDLSSNNSLKDASIVDSSDDGLLLNSLIKTAMKIEPSLPNISEESTGQKEHKDTYEDKFLWALIMNFDDYIQWFMLIYYFNIFCKLNSDEKKSLYINKNIFNELYYTNNEWIKFLEIMDELINSDLSEEKYKEALKILSDDYKYKPLINDLSDERFLHLMIIGHPFFKFDITYQHIWKNKKNKTNLFNEPVPIYLTKSLFTWTLTWDEDKHIKISDSFLDNVFNWPEIEKNSNCWRKKQFSVEINHFPKYFWIKPEYDKNLFLPGIIFEFSYILKPSWISAEKIELQGIIFSSKNNKHCVLKLKDKQSPTKDDYKWYKYNPVISAELSLLEEIFVDESSLMFGVGDLDDCITPWLILYSKIQ